MRFLLVLLILLPLVAAKWIECPRGEGGPCGHGFPWFCNRGKCENIRACYCENCWTCQDEYDLHCVNGFCEKDKPPPGYSCPDGAPCGPGYPRYCQNNICRPHMWILDKRIKCTEDNDCENGDRCIGMGMECGPGLPCLHGVCVAEGAPVIFNYTIQ